MNDYKAEAIGDHLFKVTKVVPDGVITREVDIAAQTCSSMCWQQKRFPCKHAAAVPTFRFDSPGAIASYYFTENWVKAYDIPIHVLDMKYDLIPPPKNNPGRRRRRMGERVVVAMVVSMMVTRNHWPPSSPS